MEKTHDSLAISNTEVSWCYQRIGPFAARASMFAATRPCTISTKDGYARILNA